MKEVYKPQNDREIAVVNRLFIASSVSGGNIRKFYLWAFNNWNGPNIEDNKELMRLSFKLMPYIGIEKNSIDQVWQIYIERLTRGDRANIVVENVGLFDKQLKLF
jgi:hypothetical protein